MTDRAQDLEVTVVIPAFNEKKTIADVINGVRRHLPLASILVVDDGSVDGTAEAAVTAGATVISHPLNKGNGASIKTAIRAVGTGVIAVIDADGQHDPADLPKLVGMLANYDLVVGARSFNSAQGLPLRNLGNRILSGLASFLSEQKISDLTCGFRVFKRDVAARFLHVYPNGYSFPSTSTLCFITAGYNVRFEPVRAKHRPTETKSNLKPFRDGFKFLTLILRIISLANPNKLFFPAGLFLLICGIILTIRNLVMFAQFSGGTVLFLAGGVNIIFFGLILDQFASLRIQERD